MATEVNITIDPPTKADIGLGNVDNTADVDKPVSVPQQTALDLKYDADNPDGFETPSELNARDTANRNRSNHTGTQTASTISDFGTAAAAASPVQSVAGKTGAVSLVKSDVGLSNVPNLDTTDAVANQHTHANKAVLDQTSEAFTTAVKSGYDGHVASTSNPHGVTKAQVGLGSVPNLDTTSAVNHVGNTSNPHNVTKAQVGLANVDNTSDASKPVSTAQQTALDLKVNKADEAYCLTVFASSTNFAANSNYYFGDGPVAAPPTTSGSRKVEIMKAGVIRIVRLSMKALGTTGSGAAGETITAYLMHYPANTGVGVPYQIAQVLQASAAERIFRNSSLAITCAVGDTFELRIQTPTTWGTPATTVGLSGQVYIFAS